jgi:hypothetical protein
MSTSSFTAAEGIIPEPLPVLQLRNWTLVDHPSAGALLILLVIFSVAATMWFSGSVALSASCLVALVLALWRMWLPVRFELDSRGVQQILWGRRHFFPWSCIDHFQVDRRGVLLVPRREASRVPLASTLYIGGGGHQAELCHLVSFYAGTSGRHESTVVSPAEEAHSR